MDVGNTNIKYTAFVGGDIVWRIKMPQLMLSDPKFIQFLPERIYFASVREDSESKEIAFSLKKHYKDAVPIYTLTSLCTIYGLKNPYDEPERLGVDRWLAVIAARHKWKQPTVIIDAGTALKIEFLESDGYRGGFIAPGFTMMTEMLELKTGKIKITDENPSIKNETIRNTEAAVYQGCWQMMLSFIERIYRQNKEKKFIFTGGYGDKFMKELNIDADYDQDLIAMGAKLLGDELVAQK